MLRFSHLIFRSMASHLGHKMRYQCRTPHSARIACTEFQWYAPIYVGTVTSRGLHLAYLDVCCFWHYATFKSQN
ncbi:hypothetical protein I7I50_07005 [Histoplasma capsulatum G186AR]|uniref:Uncharacterized protein n=1 Tax=Ajellomyces capsulatus TaxID=5037 RepID=A0A8H7YVY8_AJECA|nr:hypothetical protein I7I52_09921 [Histoplasma capsulatum]QSS67815.1 hypothetical protein I7I50_07005 [Histoplasma capsulatum G186AR]